jgi:hypothetical protein
MIPPGENTAGYKEPFSYLCTSFGLNDKWSVETITLLWLARTTRRSESHLGAVFVWGQPVSYRMDPLVGQDDDLLPLYPEIHLAFFQYPEYL